MSFLELKNLSKRFGSTMVLDKLSLSIQKGEFLVLVGPSGCGKSTVLRLIAGLEELSEGEIRIDGRSMNAVEPKDRDIAFVFQSYALYPHMNVFENMAFGLRMRGGISEAEIEDRVQEAAALLQLEKLLERKPKALSGGQRQRVALGRALVRKPKVFLFDEPLSNLDAHLRNQMRAEIRKLQQRLGVTSIYVTHDQVEATTMGDRIAILQGGHLQQVGTPTEVYQNPANAFVAGFIGTPEMNFLDGRVVEKKITVAGRSLEISGSNEIRAALRVGFRPEMVKVGRSGEGWRGKVELVENLGSHALVHSRLNEGGTVIALLPNADIPKVSDDVVLDWPVSSMHLFDSQSGKAIKGLL